MEKTQPRLTREQTQKILKVVSERIKKKEAAAATKRIRKKPGKTVPCPVCKKGKVKGFQLKTGEQTNDIIGPASHTEEFSIKLFACDNCQLIYRKLPNPK